MASFLVDSSGSVLGMTASSGELRGVDEKLVKACIGDDLRAEELEALNDAELAELASQATSALAELPRVR